MQCPHCRNSVGPSDAFCRHCGGSFGPQLRFTPLAPGEKPKRGKPALSDYLISFVLIAAVGGTMYWRYESRRRARNSFPAPGDCRNRHHLWRPSDRERANSHASSRNVIGLSGGLRPDKIEPGFEAAGSPGNDLPGPSSLASPTGRSLLRHHPTHPCGSAATFGRQLKSVT